MNSSSSPRSASNLFPSLILVAVTVCWGMSFSMMKDWLENSVDCPGGYATSALTMILLRMIGALAILFIVRPSLYWRPKLKAHRAGVWVGVAFFLGFALQATGLAWTTPARSAFITCFSSALVPLGMWLCFRTRIGWRTLIGLGLGVVGTGLLSFGASGDKSTQAGLKFGDLLTLGAAVFFMGQVILLDRLGKQIEPSHATVSFFATCAVGAVVGVQIVLALRGIRFADWIHWTSAMLDRPYMPLKLGTLIFFSTVLAFGLMTAYQPKVPASHAALIYLLESVFSSIIAVALGFDQLTWQLLAGGALILGGNAIVELPNWFRERRMANQVVAHEVIKT